MKNSVKVLCTLGIFVLMVLPSAVLAKQKQPVIFTKQSQELVDPLTGRTVIAPKSVDDFDPLDSNITVTVNINEIRALKTINALHDPNFFVKVTINNKTTVSDVWRNTKYVEKPGFSASSVVPNDQERVNVTIELWDKSFGISRLCDLSQDYGTYKQCRSAELTYSIATGIWWGDDMNGGGGGFEGSDPSGYGRLNGCDDNSIYTVDPDAELWFNITQTDFDHDGLPYWLEVNMYNTSPLIDNRGQDIAHTGIPVEWEHQFGLSYSEWHHGGGYSLIYDPNLWYNFTAIDPDNDGLNNIEEYKTWQWGSDPFRRDIFIDIDQMEIGPNGEGSFVPVASFDMLRDSYGKHNIVWHIDNNTLGGGERLPFKDNINDTDLSDWYWHYFMHDNATYWRRGVFRWFILAYNGTWANGFTFGSNINGTFALDCFLLSSNYHDMRSKLFPLIDGLYRRSFNRALNRAYVYAGAIMHETGHTLNIEAPGCDDPNTIWPWMTDYWRYGRYHSVMNYRYIYNGNIDYSDGSHGKNDYDDWGHIDLTLINPGFHWE
jgi:hypothetical protein